MTPVYTKHQDHLLEAKKCIASAVDGNQRHDRDNLDFAITYAAIAQAEATTRIADALESLVASNL